MVISICFSVLGFLVDLLLWSCQSLFRFGIAVDVASFVAVFSSVVCQLSFLVASFCFFDLLSRVFVCFLVSCFGQQLFAVV